jgi:branched-subunit amino acid aminotransferase/4-amino-4-deoxychorismate lyase
MTEPVVWVDGRLEPASAARISALDRGFRSGEGVFTTLGADDGRVFRLQAHLDRLLGDAAALDLTLDPEQLADAVAATVAANHHLGPRVAVRITCSAGPVDLTASFPSGGRRSPTVVVTAQAVGAAPGGAAQGYPVPWHRQLAQLKTTSYLPATLAQQHARSHGATDALLCEDGIVLEAASANLFVVHRGTVRTAPVAAGVLPGVTRSAVLEVLADLGLPTEERACSLEELRRADEAWLTSAVRGIRALTHVDDVPIAGGEAGPVTARVRAGYAALLAREQVALPGVRS